MMKAVLDAIGHDSPMARGMVSVEEYRNLPPAPDRVSGGSRSRDYVPGLPVLSITMPVLNRADVLGRAIDSVIAQTYPNIELIIIDGQSTDGTIEVLRRYDQHITRWISEKDTDPTDAMNKGLSMATGDYTVIMLSDDWLTPTFAAAVQKAFARTGADYVFGDLEIYEDEKWLFRFRGNADFKKTIRYTESFTSPGWVVKTSMLNENGLMNRFIDIAPDYELILRADVAGYVGAYDPDIVYCFLLGGRSSTNAFAGYRELRRSAIAYGANPFLAWIFYLRTAGRHAFRLTLQRVLPTGVTVGLRRFYRSLERMPVAKKTAQ